MSPLLKTIWVIIPLFVMYTTIWLIAKRHGWPMALAAAALGLVIAVTILKAMGRLT
jgi:uncharacterized membrane protein (GlpM family)